MTSLVPVFGRTAMRAAMRNGCEKVELFLRGAMRYRAATACLRTFKDLVRHQVLGGRFIDPRRAAGCKTELRAASGSA